MHADNEKETPKRAVVYTRISRDQSGEGLGVDRQESACRALANSRGWQVIRVFTENDTSALKKRPQYQEMLQFIKNGGAEVVIGWAVDRITRTPREIEDLIDLSEATGVVIATASGDLDLSTDGGRLVGRILGSVARGEVERKGARQRASNQAWAKAGKPARQRRCYGYDIKGKIIEEEAEIVREVFTRFAAGTGIITMEKEFAERGLVSSTGRPWTRTGLRGLLQNPRLVAEQWQGGTYVGKGEWDPIIERDVFVTVNAKLNDPTRRTQKSTGRKWLGSGLYICGVDGCGRAVRSSYAQSNHRPDGSRPERRVYVCSSLSGHLLRYAKPVDEQVTTDFLNYLERIDLAALVAGEQDADEVQRLLEEEVALRNRRKGLPLALAQGLILPKQMREATGHIDGMLEVNLGKQAAFGKGTALGPMMEAEDPTVWWLEQDVATRQAVMRLLCQVTLLPGARGRAPFDPASVRIVFRDRLSNA